jgi:Family of unknown function (DUF6266)
MINNSPWLWGDTKTAAGMTTRTSRGQHIIQGKRAKGQSNPSNDYKSAQQAAAAIWPYFRKAGGFVRQFFKTIPTGSTAAAEFYKYAYNNAFTPDGFGGGSLDIANIVYAKGTMTPTSILTFAGDVSDNAITATWPTTNADASQQNDDIAEYVILNVTQNKAISGTLANQRSTGTAGSIVPPAGFLVAGDVIKLYLSFTSNTTPLMDVNQSTSVYETAIVTA